MNIENEKNQLIESLISRRRDLGISKWQLSKMSGVSHFTITNIEQKKGYSFTIDSYLKIKKSLYL